MSDPDLNHVPDCFPDKDETVAGTELKQQVYGAVRAGKRRLLGANLVESGWRIESLVKRFTQDQ